MGPIGKEGEGESSSNVQMYAFDMGGSKEDCSKQEYLWTYALLGDKKFEERRRGHSRGGDFDRITVCGGGHGCKGSKCPSGQAFHLSISFRISTEQYKF